MFWKIYYRIETAIVQIIYPKRGDKVQKIAIEENLLPFKDYLADKGYRVESINFSKGYTNNTDRFDAYVITGMSANFLGVNDTNTKAVVIEAKGKTPEQVYDELKSRFD